MRGKIIPVLLTCSLFASGAQIANFDINRMALGMNAD